MRRCVVFLACLFFLSSAGYSVWLIASNNFHSVVVGEVYRSAQPSAGQLADYADRYGIRTVINLRPGKFGEQWYDEEIAESDRLGLSHIDFPMSSSSVLPKEKAMALIAVLATARKPILIHCKAGSDRTGLASALYLAAIAGSSEAVAESQISLRYGHFSIPYFSRAYAMDKTFEHLEDALGIEERS